MEAIYAVDSNNGLAKNGIIPWKSKRDMQFFYSKTKHNIVIMGKNTYFSIPEEYRPLKNRVNVVLTNHPERYCSTNPFENVIFTSNQNIHESILENRNRYCNLYDFLVPDFTLFFIGGKTIYEKYIPLCNKVWVTRIKQNYDCDLFIDEHGLLSFTMTIYYEDDELTILEYYKNV